MLAYIRGILQARNSDSVVVETCGLGFSINVPLTALERLPETGSGSQNIYIYSYS